VEGQRRREARAAWSIVRVPVGWVMVDEKAVKQSGRSF
jgi:hypothetical protein